MNVMVIIFYAAIPCKPENADAQYNFGVIYENGEAVSQNYLQANAWYKKAAAQNDAQAQFDPGVMNERAAGGRLPELTSRFISG